MASEQPPGGISPVLKETTSPKAATGPLAVRPGAADPARVGASSTNDQRHLLLIYSASQVVCGGRVFLHKAPWSCSS
jgi:hypothetical protein